MLKIVFMLFFVVTGFGIELEPRVILDGKVRVLVPKGFDLMTSEMLNLKYRGANRPTLVFTDSSGSVNLAFNLLNTPASEKQIPAYKEAVKSSFTKSFPAAVWIADGIKAINGREVAYLQLITEAIDQKVYNYIFMTHCDGRLLIATFNCTEKLLPEWKDSAEQIVGSLRVLDKSP